MTKIKFALLFFLISTITLAQTTYEPGYYISQTGSKVSGFIKNIDWKNNPQSFSFKTTLEGESQTYTVDNTKSFGFENGTIYERHLIKLDNSSDVTTNLNYNKNPELFQEIHFVKMLLSGTDGTKFFVHKRGTIINLYYQKGDAPLELLIYKRYLTNDSKVGSNNHFKQQLKNAFPIKNASDKLLVNLKYRTNDVKKYIEKYLIANNFQTNVKQTQRTAGSFAIKPIIGATFSSLNTGFIEEFDNPGDYGNYTSLTYGIEFEYLLPFNNNKWSLFTDVRYSEYEGSNKDFRVRPFGLGTREFDETVNISILDWSLGVRHYFFLNKTNKIFLGINVANEISIKYTAKSNLNDKPAALVADRSDRSLGLSIGYTYSRFSAELRYITTKNHLARSFTTRTSDYNSLMITLGYKLVKL